MRYIEDEPLSLLLESMTPARMRMKMSQPGAVIQEDENESTGDEDGLEKSDESESESGKVENEDEHKQGRL